MTTPSDDEALARLRALKAERDQNEDLYDRFGDERFSRQAYALSEEIAKMPAHILNADAIETRLQGLTYVVEDYLIARAAQFLPDVDDLWATIQALPGREGNPETPAETPVIGALNALRALGASDDDLRQAVNEAARLESYRNPHSPRRVSRTTPGVYRDYDQMLRRHVRDFLKKNAGQASGGMPVHTSSELMAIIHRWQREFAAQVEPEQRPDTYWGRYYRQMILSAIAVLRRLDKSDREIELIIADAHDQWRTGKK